MDDAILTRIKSLRNSFSQVYEREISVTPDISAILCNNPGPMTLQGTNTWIIHAGQLKLSNGMDFCIDSEIQAKSDTYPPATMIIIDPGPLEETHLQILTKMALSAGEQILILLTHSHPDHSGSAIEFAQYTGAVINSGQFLPAERIISESKSTFTDEKVNFFQSILPPDDFLTTSLGRLYSLSTPGHTDDSVSYFLDAIHPGPYQILFSGDTILGAGSTILLAEDALRKYFASLQRIIALGPEVILAPGHGNICLSARDRAEEMLEHRTQRLDLIQKFLAAENISLLEAVPAQLVPKLYKNTIPELRFAAELTIAAQIEYLLKQDDQ